MKSNLKIFTRLYGYFILVAILSFSEISFAQKPDNPATMQVGVASIDITPDGPIRLAGYGARVKSESEGILQRLHAKALAFGSDAENPTILITVDPLKKSRY